MTELIREWNHQTNATEPSHQQTDWIQRRDEKGNLLRQRRGHTLHHERIETKADLDVKVRIDRDWNRGGYDL